MVSPHLRGPEWYFSLITWHSCTKDLVLALQLPMGQWDTLCFGGLEPIESFPDRTDVTQKHSPWGLKKGNVGCICELCLLY